nr:TNT domain-containing protein [Dyella sedimenti]
MAGGQAIANSFGLAGLLSGGITGSVASDSSAVANPAVPNTTAVDTSLASGADASAIRARVLSNIADSQAARASSNFGQFSQVEGQLQEALGIWPPNNGGYAPIYNTTLDVGTQLDRFGFPGGTYLSPLGDSFGGRALPSSYLTTKPYFQYEVIQPIPGVTQAKALPWFGQPGMGTQFQVPNSVQWYLNNGYLKVIHP